MYNTSKTHKRFERTLFYWTRQHVRIFEEILFFEAAYNTKINNQYTYLLPVGCLDASGRKRARDRRFAHFVLSCQIKVFFLTSCVFFLQNAGSQLCFRFVFQVQYMQQNKIMHMIVWNNKHKVQCNVTQGEATQHKSTNKAIWWNSETP